MLSKAVEIGMGWGLGVGKHSLPCAPLHDHQEDLASSWHVQPETNLDNNDHPEIPGVIHQPPALPSYLQLFISQQRVAVYLT